MKIFEIKNSGDYPNLRCSILSGEHIDILIIDNEFSFNNLFYDIIRADEQGEITDLHIDTIDCSKTSTLKMMFADLHGLKKVPKLINTDKVVSTDAMFAGCFSLKRVPMFDTHNVVKFTGMFVDCYNLKTVPLFNMEKTQFTNYMFFGCTHLKSVPKFNLKNVENAMGMFFNCINLKRVPNLELLSVKQMGSMFEGCDSLEKLPKVTINIEKFLDGILLGKL